MDDDLQPTETVFVQRATYLLPPELIYRIKDVADEEGLTDNLIVQTAVEDYIARLEEARGGRYAARKRELPPLAMPAD